MKKDLSNDPEKRLEFYVEDFNRLCPEKANQVSVDELDTEAKIAEFHKKYAEIVEKTNEYKMLYQVLLDEYEALGILKPEICRSQRVIAAEKIRERLIDGTWHGTSNLESRAKFRVEMMRLIRDEVHKAARERAKIGGRISALCLSGGGIRSATFGLGVIQALAGHGLLEHFDYLSTVSGGGYIGSWLSAWIHRLDKPEDDNGASNAQTANLSDSSTTFSNRGAVEVTKRLTEPTAGLPEPVEVTHLRSYSNYMSPRTGLFSTDTWTLIAVYLRNLLLNWTVFLPLIAAFLLLPRLLADIVGVIPQLDIARYVGIAALVTGGVVVTNINAMRPSFKGLSWVDQRFVADEIGVYSSVESKVFRWVVVWVILFGVTLTIFIQSAGETAQFEWSNQLVGAIGGSHALYDSIILGELMFVGGYLVMLMLFGLKYLVRGPNQLSEAEINASNKRPWTYYFFELLVSFVCGAIGGAMLYGIHGLIEIGRLAARWYLPRPANDAEVMFLATFGPVAVVIAFLLAATVFVGLAVGLSTDDDREWTSRLGASLLVIQVGWVVVSAAVFLGPIVLGGDVKGMLVWLGGAVSGATALYGGFSSKTPGSPDNVEKKAKSGMTLLLLTSIAAPAFVVFLAALISFLTDRLMGAAGLFGEWRNFAWFVIFLGSGFLAGLFVNINKFSFHSIYRERLIRAYLGASRTKDRLKTANSFTGLDIELDNVDLRHLLQKPYHIVNMTLNLVKTQNLRWQNRKAESFTASALYCGSSSMGEGSGNFRKSLEYGLNRQNNSPISLGTAAAISGAAASPNMGYITQNAAVSFLMVLFNVRLGWWLGNPGSRGKRTWNQSAPRWSPKLLLDESVGGTDDARPYVYLSDGGHFDNLGVYEMILRRCSLIVVIDAACDADYAYSDLGNAIHKVRVDLGIPIEFNLGQRPARNVNCGVATIGYSRVDDKGAQDGVLVYIKPTLDGDEPVDLKNYAHENPLFPHQSTIDQFYSETQFESYRSLGFHQMDVIAGEKRPNPALADIESKAREYLSNIKAD